MVLLAACSGGPELPTQLTGAPLGQSDLPTAEVYSRIAAGINRCWLGPEGPLKPAYMMHAEVAPEALGGEAEIALHDIARDQPTPRGARAFRIALKPTGAVTLVETENVKLAVPLAAALKSDVESWVRGAESCAAAAVDPALLPPKPVVAAGDQAKGNRKGAGKQTKSR